MPTVDSPIPGGLSRDEAVTLLSSFARQPETLGLQVAIYDPTLDPDAQGASLLVDLLSEVLTT